MEQVDFMCRPMWCICTNGARCMDPGALLRMSVPLQSTYGLLVNISFFSAELNGLILLTLNLWIFLIHEDGFTILTKMLIINYCE